MKTLSLFLIMIMAFPSWGADVVGRWKTIDDETGQPKSVVEIFREGDEIKGKIVELINPKEPNPKCDKCPGEQKDQPIVGLQIISKLKESEAGAEWSGGQILDPNNGKVYKCRLRLQDEGKKLEVRGFIGFSLIGRSQVWLREPAP